MRLLTETRNDCGSRERTPRRHWADQGAGRGSRAMNLDKADTESSPAPRLPSDAVPTHGGALVPNLSGMALRAQRCPQGGSIAHAGARAHTSCGTMQCRDACWPRRSACAPGSSRLAYPPESTEKAFWIKSAQIWFKRFLGAATHQVFSRNGHGFGHLQSVVQEKASTGHRSDRRVSTLARHHVGNATYHSHSNTSGRL